MRELEYAILNLRKASVNRGAYFWSEEARDGLHQTGGLLGPSSSDLIHLPNLLSFIITRLAC